MLAATGSRSTRREHRTRALPSTLEFHHDAIQEETSNRPRCSRLCTGRGNLQFLFGYACVGLLLIATHLGLAGPANGLQSLGQNRVAVMVRRVHPVRVHGGQVLDLKFDEGRGKLSGVAELVGEGI